MHQIIGYATWYVKITKGTEVIDEHEEREVVGVFYSLDDFDRFVDNRRTNDVHVFPSTYEGDDYKVSVESYKYTYEMTPHTWSPTNQLYLIKRASMGKSNLIKGILENAVKEYKELD